MFRKGVRLRGPGRKVVRLAGYVREDLYRKAMASGAEAGTFEGLTHEEYAEGYWNGETTEGWVLLFIVPPGEPEYALAIRNGDRREGQPAEARVPLEP